MSERIRVIHICDKFSVSGSSIHGVGRLFSWWFPRFDRDNFDVSLVGLRPEDRASRDLANEGIDITTLNKGKYDVTTLSALSSLLRERKPHIVHLHGYAATIFGIPAAKKLGIKIVLHEHFVDPNMPFYQKPFDYALCSRVDIGMANCEAVREFMIEKRHLPENKTLVVYNGAPVENFQQAEMDAVVAERRRWGIPDDYKIIATIGRLDEQKGNKYFVDAAASLLKERTNLKFLMVGDGPLMEDLKKQCEQEGISDDVIFTGFQANIPLIQSMLDIQVFPSLWEGTTLTVFEAMSVGVPIVSTDVDGLGEVLDHERNALLVNAANASKLSAAIARVLDQPDLAKTLISNATEDVNTKFNIQTTVDTLQNVYSDLVKGERISVGDTG